MTTTEYVLGVARLLVATGAVVFTAVRIRRRIVPNWSSAFALLTDCILAMALLTVALELVGTVGLFSTVPIVAVCMAVGVAGVFIKPSVAEQAPGRDVHEPPEPVSVWAAVFACALVAAVWAAGTSAALRDGITESDSLHYHLPYAARFVQNESLTHLYQVTPEFPWSFHPANTELLHAFGMTMFHRDVVSPFLNLGFAALALLAAWCIGERSGRGPLCVVGCAVILGSPVVASQAGTAHNDIAVVFLVLATIAFLREAADTRAGIAIAGVTAGLALGTKLTALAPVGVLAVSYLGLFAWKRRRDLAFTWVLAAVATGGFWFVRNLVRTGSPIPSLHIGVGPIAFPSPDFAVVDQFGPSVLHYATKTDVWRDWFVPGLGNALGIAWVPVLVLVIASFALSILRGQDRTVRIAAVVGVVGVVAYLASPTSAGGMEGRPFLFESNLRYVTAELALGLVLLALVPIFRDRRRQAALAAVLGVVLLAEQRSDLNVWSEGERAALVAGVLAVAVGTALAIAYLRPTRLRIDRRVAALAAVALVVVVALAGRPIVRRYERGRDAESRLAAFGVAHHDVRIGVAGIQRLYPLYGPDLSNYVQYIGREDDRHGFHDIADCEAWWEAVQRGNYDFLALGDGYGSGPPSKDPNKRGLAWTANDPSVRLVQDAEGVTIFRVAKDASTPHCTSP